MLGGLLTKQQAAEYCQVTVREVQAWVDAREVDFVILGGVVRFEQRALDKLINERTVRACSSFR